MDIVDVNGNRLSLTNGPFVADLARYAEGILSEKAVKRRYALAPETWEALGSDDDLVEAIETEKARRIRDGSTARERAQALHAESPSILGSILKDPGAPPRVRIDSAKELRAVAANTGPETTALSAADRFQIIINLGSEVLKFDKTTNKFPDVIDNDPQELLPWTSFDD